jgi:hypothetical protein
MTWGVEPLSKKWPVLTIVCEGNRELPDYFDSGGKPVVSDRFSLI